MLRIPVIWIMIYAIIVCAISLSFLDPTLSAHLASVCRYVVYVVEVLFFAVPRIEAAILPVEAFNLSFSSIYPQRWLVSCSYSVEESTQFLLQSGDSSSTDSIAAPRLCFSDPLLPWLQCYLSGLLHFCQLKS